MQPTTSQSQFVGFQIQSQLAKGSFGTVFKAKSINPNHQSSQTCAIKVQIIGAIKPMLHLQYQILSKLKQAQAKTQTKSPNKGFSFPQVFAFKDEQYFTYMAMQLLDITLEDFANKQMKNTFSKDCLIRILYNLLKIIQQMHNLGYIHRDIKPANFMLKTNPNIDLSSEAQDKYFPKIYPIDLGLCKSYINPITRQHIAKKQNKKMVGTAMFCSLNTHEGLQQSRRDDIEALIYMVTYMCKKLPWESVCNKQFRLNAEVKNQISSQGKKLQEKQKLEKYQQIYKIKKDTNINQFLDDADLLPRCFLQIFRKVRKFEFQQEPDYQEIYSILDKQHKEITGIQFCLEDFGCVWKKLSKQPKLQLKPDNLQEKKKIKINFKIPQEKLKKPIIPNVGSISSKIEDTKNQQQ